MAMAATLLKQEGHEVMWSDGPAEGLSWQEQSWAISRFDPDLVVWEVKTPSVIGTWGKANSISRQQIVPGNMRKAKVVLVGDHVTALPEESTEQPSIWAVITGGDYDFGLLNYIKAGCPKGIFRQKTDSDLKHLPVVDRKLTRWEDYGYEHGSGNYKYLPGTHSMIGRDCWWRHQGGCTFCSWTNTFKNWRVGTTDQLMAEVENCASLGIRELFDDTGTFPIGNWLHDFCEKLIKFNGGNRHGKAKVTMGCNMRPGALGQESYDLMGRAGFRFILYGLESANHATLEKINKGQAPHDIESTVRMAKSAGLEPHVTCMIGYPWESKKEAENTIALTRKLFAKGWIDTLQATIVIPYPGTELYRQCVENDWLRYQPGDWDKWDMRSPVMKCPMTDEEVLGITRGVYKAFLSPQYMARKLVNVRTKDDLKFLGRGLKLLYGHLLDFSGRKS